MQSIKIYPLVLLTMLGLASAKLSFSQTLTNTENVITISGTCMNSKLSTGTYTLTLYYVDPDNGGTYPAPVSVSVVVNGTTATITLPSSTLPTPATNGYWSLPDADQGSITLTGTGGGVMVWYHDENNDLQFNCDPLGIFINHSLLSDQKKYYLPGKSILSIPYKPTWLS